MNTNNEIVVQIEVDNTPGTSDVPSLNFSNHKKSRRIIENLCSSYFNSGFDEAKPRYLKLFVFSKSNVIAPRIP